MMGPSPAVSSSALDRSSRNAPIKARDWVGTTVAFERLRLQKIGYRPYLTQNHARLNSEYFSGTQDKRLGLKSVSSALGGHRRLLGAVQAAMGIRPYLKQKHVRRFGILDRLRLR